MIPDKSTIIKWACLLSLGLALTIFGAAFLADLLARLVP